MPDLPTPNRQLAAPPRPWREYDLTMTQWPRLSKVVLFAFLWCGVACGGDDKADVIGSGGTSGGGVGATAGSGGSGGSGGSAGSGGSSSTSGGPLGISDDGHWLQFRGRSVLLAGDSITQGWMELGANFNQTAYLDALASRGIQVMMLWAFIGVEDQQADPRIGYDAPEIWPWPQAGNGFDLGSFNDSYFQRLRTLVSEANDLDIVVLLTIHDGWTKTRFAGHPFNVTLGGPLTDGAQYVELHDYQSEMTGSFDPGWSRPQKHQFYLEQFCDRLISETGDLPNVMYEMFNEGEWYDQVALRAFQVHFLDFFDGRTPQPLLVNDDHVGGADFRGEAKADVITLHHPLWTPSISASESFNHYAPQFGDTPVKPAFFSEPVPSFEGNAGEQDATMRLMWGTLMGGAGFVVQNDTSFGFDPNTTMASLSAERDAILDLEGHAARFFSEGLTSLDGLVPNATGCSTGICLVRPGDTYIAYLENGSNLTVDVSATSGELQARFYDPRSGTFEPPIQVWTHSPVEPFEAPSVGDWVLLVRQL